MNFETSNEIVLFSDLFLRKILQGKLHKFRTSNKYPNSNHLQRFLILIKKVVEIVGKKNLEKFSVKNSKRNETKK